jgi:RimJ/RimL family protein N-acetyltransferase
MFARTERLLLRPGWTQDAPALFEAIADEGVVRNLASAPWPYTPADAEAFLATERDAHDATALIFRRTEDAPQLVGTIGIGTRPDGERELGYFIARGFWGRGYATEAGWAVLDFARDSLRLPRLNAGYFLDNPASGRVLEKLGFAPTGVVTQRYSAGRREAAPCRLLELDLAEPEARAPVRDCTEVMAAA